MGDLSSIFAVAGTGASWFGEPVGKEIIDMAKGAIKAEWERFKWPEAEQRYRSRLREIYRYTKLLGNSKQIEIEGIFTDVYILNKLSAESRYSIEELQNSFKEKKRVSLYKGERYSLIELVAQEKRLYLLGKPGSGKTTFLRYLTLQACDGKIKETPIFVELKEWAASGLDLMAYIVEQFKICAFPNAQTLIEYLLEKGYALVLFDGLDEVNQEGEQRTNMIRELKNFARQYPYANICLTCRIAASDYSFEQFTYLEIADFTDEQVEQFARKWYRDDLTKGERFLGEISKPEHSGLKELASTPILLALLCLTFDETLAFPQNQTELYEEALDALLKRWDRTRNIRRDSVYKNMTLIRRKSMLAQIAAENFENNHYLMPKRILAGQIVEYMKRLLGEEASEDVDGEDILRAIEAQHGLLVERAHSFYSFSHISFQEYLTAHYIFENCTNKFLERLIHNHMTDKRWREVFLMTASLLPDGTDFLDELLRAIEWYLCKDKTNLAAVQSAYLIAAPNFLKLPEFCNEAILLIYSIHLIRKRGNILSLAYKQNLDLHRVQNLLLNIEYAFTHCIILTQSLVFKFGREFAPEIRMDFLKLRDSIQIFDVNYAIVQNHIIVDKIFYILANYYDIYSYNQKDSFDLENEQIDHFNDYLYVNQLFTDCLLLSNIRDVRFYLSRLIIPPIHK